MRRLLHWLLRSLPVLLMVIAWEAAVRRLRRVILVWHEEEQRQGVII